METEELAERPEGNIEDAIRDMVRKTKGSRKYRAIKKFIMAALGSIPWVGGFLEKAAEFRDEETGQLKVNELFKEWLEEHRRQLERLREALAEMELRLHQFGDEVADRLESETFLSLVRQGFRAWDEAETEEKRGLIRKLLTNAAGTQLCPDDLVRLFITWIGRYHEAHFKVIRAIFEYPGITRAEIWEEIHGDPPREDSAEADLFKLLIHDMSLGHVIRQQRATTGDGRFLKKPRPTRWVPASRVMKSAFDDKESYELTDLGRQFVHYTMNEVVPGLNDSQSAETKIDPPADPV